MRVSLRKANAIQIAVNEALRGLEFNTSVSVNEFQTPTEVIDASVSVFWDNMARRTALTDALYEIRKAVSSANHTAGIDQRLADVARLEKEIVFLGGIVSRSKVMEDLNVVNGKLDRIRNRSEENFYRETEVSTGIFKSEHLERFRKQIADAKKQKQRLQDELLEANVRVEIEFSAETVEALKAADII